ncbi:MAG: acetyl-CoA C-acetyltransferase [candidate division Zixibacteria bacterium]|nr:acetyl-CoA C-acetyltransferase [candidate division Zixibacteria bacterium]
MPDNKAYIVSACRTAIGVLHGGLGSKTAPELGALAIKEAVSRSRVKAEDVNEVIMGHVLQGGCGQAPARQAAIHAGLSYEIPALTINKVCGSGLKAVMLAAQSIKAGDNEVVVAGGMESMSNAPMILHGAKTGLKFGHKKILDLMITDGLWDSFNNFHMGIAAEQTASKAGISREEQDKFAYDSQQKAAKAQVDGKFDEEIFDVEIPQRKADPIIFNKDENVRGQITLEKLAKLRPVFDKEGSVTAGNASSLNDGASCTVVVSEKYLKDNNLTPMARIVDYAVAGTKPEDLFFAPIFAVQKLMAKMNVEINHWDLFEANEAFASQMLADSKELKWDSAKVNVNGGAIALGHPIGASGARVLTTLIYALKDRNLKTGLATLCLGGGNAVAMAIERE